MLEKHLVTAKTKRKKGRWSVIHHKECPCCESKGWCTNRLVKRMNLYKAALKVAEAYRIVEESTDELDSVEFKAKAKASIDAANEYAALRQEEPKS